MEQQLTSAEVVELTGIVLTFLATWATILLTSRKNKNERDKLEAETAGLYAELSNKQTKLVAELTQQITKLRLELAEKTLRIGELGMEIADLRATLDQKDSRIRELETLSKRQEVEINTLRLELDQLKRPSNK